MNKSRKKIAQDYARNAIVDGDTKAGRYEKKMAVKEAAGEGPSMKSEIYMAGTSMGSYNKPMMKGSGLEMKCGSQLGKYMGGPKMMGGDEPRGTREEMQERRAVKKEERSQKKSDRLIGKYDDQYSRKKEAIKIKKDKKIDKTLKQYQENKITDALLGQKLNKSLGKQRKKIAKAKAVKDRRVGFKKDIGQII